MERSTNLEGPAGIGAVAFGGPVKGFVGPVHSERVAL